MDSPWLSLFSAIDGHGRSKRTVKKRERIMSNRYFYLRRLCSIDHIQILIGTAFRQPDTCALLPLSIERPVVMMWPKEAAQEYRAWCDEAREWNDLTPTTPDSFYVVSLLSRGGLSGEWNDQVVNAVAADRNPGRWGQKNEARHTGGTRP